MGPADVVAYVMQSLSASIRDEALGFEAGAKVLLSFAASVDDGKPEDFLGQVQLWPLQRPWAADEVPRL